MNEYLPWLSLALLGVYHGLNPGMGWLFAVALGLQEGSRAAVLRAFGPIAIGHAASVGVVVAMVGVAQLWVDPDMLRVLGASALIAFGLYKLLAPMSHPRWVRMRVKARDLVGWSFLMSTAHGAGLMLVPVLFQLPSSPPSHTAHAAHVGPAAHMAMMTTSVGPSLGDVAAVGAHTLAMFLAMAVIAVVVFEKVGLAVLRRAWFNLDRLWAGALIAAGGLTFAL